MKTFIRKSIGGISALFVCLGLVSCKSNEDPASDPFAELDEPDITDYSEVSIELDRVRGLVALPIDPYLVNTDFSVAVQWERAYETVLDSCVNELGQRNPSADPNYWTGLQPVDDRRFGQWDANTAKLAGFSFDPDRGIPRTGALLRSPAAQRAIEMCESETAELEEIGRELSEVGLPERISGNASRFAEQSESAIPVQLSYRQCLTDRGILFEDQSGQPIDAYSYVDADEQRQIALDVVDCNLSSGRIELLYTLQAQYESAFIQMYRDELEQRMEEKTSLLQALREFAERYAVE